MSLSGLSLFSGAGGMDIGFKEAGIDVLWANDFDKAACDTFEANNLGPIEHGDINLLIPSLKKFTNKIDVVFGGPPCQGFSVAGKMDPNDERNKLVGSFLQVVKLLKPRAFVMENVKSLGSNPRWATFREELINEYAALGYKVKLTILTASDYGVPQKRERVFLIGLRQDTYILEAFDQLLSAYEMPGKSVRDAIAHLGPPGSPGNDLVCNAGITLASNPVLRKSPYAGMLFNGLGRPLNLEAPSTTMSASMGGNKTHIVDQKLLENPNADNWIANYHSHVMSGGAPYDWKEVPNHLRRLTANEALRLQTFPENFILKCSKSSAFRLIGNAVPCILAKVVGSALIDMLNLSAEERKSLKKGAYARKDSPLLATEVADAA